MFDSWGWQEWLGTLLFFGWCLRAAFKTGYAMGRDDLHQEIVRDPERTIQGLEAHRKTMSRWRKFARGQ